MSTCLILQVLGNNDVLCNGQQGSQVLQGNTLEEVQEQAKWNDEDFRKGKASVNFPFITEIVKKYQEKLTIYLGIILTDQSQWIKHQDIAGSQWKEIISSDGHWWHNILTEWCQQQNISFCSFILNIDEKISKGVADWEGMASLLESYLNQKITQKLNGFELIFEGQKPTIFNKIIIQYSSGTPALSSALYLWGIEQKLANLPIEFIYLSRSDSRPDSHEGEHWQWRLKVPQIHQLLNIQDFAGVLALLKAHPNKSLKTTVRKLDWAVSLNLTKLKLGLNEKQSINERIAIAVWSEEAFRQRGQWMHWYLRVAGAFELAILSLVEHQGQGQYQWQKEEDKFFLKHLSSEKELRYEAPILTQLLSQGNYLKSFRQGQETITVSYFCTSVANDNNWNAFKAFYLASEWQLTVSVKKSFSRLRNELYHALQGDIIDEYLDLKTQELGLVTHQAHPAQVAINQLHYLLDLAHLSNDIKTAVSKYKTWVTEVKDKL